MARETSDLTELEVFIFELEFRVKLQQDILNAFEARGLGQSEPADLLERLQGSFRHAHVARELLIQRAEISVGPAELIEIHQAVPIQPILQEGPLPDKARHVTNIQL